jgi:hypothetical protein
MEKRKKDKKKEGEVKRGVNRKRKIKKNER